MSIENAIYLWYNSKYKGQPLIVIPKVVMFREYQEGALNRVSVIPKVFL